MNTVVLTFRFADVPFETIDFLMLVLFLRSLMMAAKAADNFNRCFLVGFFG